jgi:DNA-binding MarR family transcriptional regulator
MADRTEIAELIERLAAVLAGEQRAVWDAHDLHPVHGRILLYLAHANRYSDTAAAVVEYLGATKGTVSQSIERLVERGLVARKPDARDRRTAHLALTSSGQRLVEAACPPPAWRTALTDAPPALAGALEQLLGRLQQASGRRRFGACATCRHHQVEGPGRFRCGLTSEPLSADDRARWCREHESSAG